MDIYDIKVLDRNNKEISLSTYKGKTILVVNTATGCGFTPQYKGLQELYDKYKDKDFVILDFPCNQFGNQAPGSDDEIHEFCTAKYQTTFDQFKKIDVNGENADPVFKYLEENSPEEYIKGLKNKMAMKAVKKISSTCKKDGDIVWNFTKFLVDKNGNAIKRYNPTFNPDDIENDIIELL